ncbi:MAG: hypothetical protein IJ774_02230 [Selenomonadaceae bacterium]|nr:hypothetical protein [Selenomonadaceae bacterium]
MKKLIVLVALLCTVMISSTAAARDAVRGVVVYYNYSSDKIIIETNRGFTCGEIMSGYFLDTSHVVVGSLESYGTHEMYDLTSDRSFRMWVDEYWLDSDSALEWLGR